MEVKGCHANDFRGHMLHAWCTLARSRSRADSFAFAHHANTATLVHPLHTEQLVPLGFQIRLIWHFDRGLGAFLLVHPTCTPSE